VYKLVRPRVLLKTPLAPTIEEVKCLDELGGKGAKLRAMRGSFINSRMTLFFCFTHGDGHTISSLSGTVPIETIKPPWYDFMSGNA
jgi:hypothetical protein